MKTFTRTLIKMLLLLTIYSTAFSQQVFKTANIGIGTTTPAQKIEIAGSTNTMRIGGLVAGGTYNPLTPAATSASDIIYVNNSNGDIYGLANGTNGTILSVSATGVPTWVTPSSFSVTSVTANLPLTVTGNASAPVINLIGASGQILYGTGTASAFTTGGAAGQFLQWSASGIPTWATPSTSGTAWQLIGNGSTTAGTNFIGTTDANDLVFKTHGVENMRINNSSGFVNIGTPPSALTLLNLYSTALSGTGQVGITLQDGASGGGTYRLWVSDNGNGEGAGKFFVWDNTARQNRIAINSSGDIGIGTNSPANELDVNGAEAVGYAGTTAPSSGLIVSGNTGIGTTTPKNKLDVSGAEAVGSYAGSSTAPSNGLIVSGNVGIGTNNPGTQLEVDQVDNGGGTGVLYLNSSGSESGIGLRKTANGTQQYSIKDGDNSTAASYFAIHDETAAGATRLVIASSTGDVGLNTTTPKSRLDVSGNQAIGSYAGANAAPTNGLIVSGIVGIGTNNPGTQLEVDQTDNGGSTGMLYLNSSGSESGIGLRKTSNGTQQYSIKDGDNGTAASYLAFRDETAGGTARLVIANSTGYVGLGTTSPSQELQVQGNFYLSNAFMPAGSAGNSGNLLLSAGAGSAPTWLVNGTNGTVLTMVSGVPTWATPAAAGVTSVTASSPLSSSGGTTPIISISGTNGGVLYGTGAGAAFSAGGDSLQILESLGPGNGVKWVNASSFDTTATGDNWGTQYVITDSISTGGTERTLTGTGLAANPLKLARQGASTGQVLEWNGITWTPATVSAGTSGWALTGNASTTAGTNFVGTTDGNALVFKTDGFEGMRITNGGGSSAGLVGIGTASPATQLEVDQIDNGGSTGMLYLNSTGTESGIGFRKTTNGTQQYSIKDGDNTSGASYFAIHDETASGNPARMVILPSTGYVGMGTTSPTQELQVQGNFYLTNAFMPGNNAGSTGNILLSAGAGNAPTWLTNGTAGYVLTSNGTSSAPSWQAVSGGSGSGWALTGNASTTAGTNFVGTTDANDLVFKTNSTEYMRIVSTTSGSVHAGSVGIGTTSPLTLLTITSSSLSGTGEVGLTIQNTASGGGTYRLWSSDNGNGEGAGKFFIWDNTASQNRVAINSSGDVGLGTNSPAQELDVEGNGGSIRFAGELMPGGNAGTTGQVLTSNGSSSAPSWQTPSGGGSGWALTGNSSTAYGTNFIGTSDNVGLMFKVDGQVSGRIESASATSSSWQNTSFGYQALNNTTGSNYDWYNTAIGYQALKSNQYGSFNVAVGVGALTNNTGTSNSASSGAQNVAVGSSALNANTTGSYNVGIGQNAIINGNGSYNTMVGCNVASNAAVTGSFNEGIGYQTFQNLTAGQYNDAMGYQAQYNLSSGTANVAMGYHALYNNTAAASNVAVGYSSQTNTIASKNVSVGDSTLYTNTTGSGNTALGYRANVSSNNLTNATAIGANATVSSNNVVQLGNNASVQFDKALMPGGNAGTAGYVLQSNGAGNAPTWVAPSGGNITDSSSTSSVENTITGNGSASYPLKISQDNATSGQVLQWNGTTWKPATVSGGVGDNWGTQVVVTNSTLTGNGTSGSVLGIAQQGAATGQALEWNGTAWAPATVSGTGWSLTGNTGTNPGTDFIGTTDAKDLVFKTHNNEIMRIANSTNNVGIGTSTPNSASELEIDQNYNGGGIGMIHLNSSGGEAGISMLNGNGQQYSFKDGDAGSGATYFAIHDESDGSTPLVITPGNYNDVNASFMGINQTGPQSVLDLFYSGGDASGNAGVTIENGSSQSYRLWVSDGSNQEDNGNGGFLIWDNNNSTDRFLLTPNGQFGLNLGQNGTPQSELDVNGNVTIGGDYAGNNGAPNNGMLVEGATSIGTTSNANELDVAGNMAIGSYAGANSAPSGGLIVSGNVGIATNSPNSTLQIGSGSANSGNVSMPINVLSSSGTINLSTSPNNYTVILTATPSVTLPAAAAGNKGRIYIFVNGTANAGTISSFIPHGTSTASTTFPASVTLQIQSSGTGWYQIN